MEVVVVSQCTWTEEEALPDFSNATMCNEACGPVRLSWCVFTHVLIFMK